jgi:hypothetical protein
MRIKIFNSLGSKHGEFVSFSFFFYIFAAIILKLLKCYNATKFHYNEYQVVTPTTSLYHEFTVIRMSQQSFDFIPIILRLGWLHVKDKQYNRKQSILHTSGGEAKANCKDVLAHHFQLHEMCLAATFVKILQPLLVRIKKDSRRYTTPIGPP